MNVTGECTVSGSREALFDKLADPFFFASCFDGVSGLTETGPGRYDAAFETTVAYMKFRFKMQVEIVRLARPETIETKIEGTPAGIGGRLAATTRLEHARLHHQYQRRRTAPVVTVERAYYRDDPIIVGRPPAKPPNDYSYSKAVMRSALLFDALVAAGVPDVKAVWARTRSAARACSPWWPSRSATPVTRARPDTSSTSAAPAPTCRATPLWWTMTSTHRTCRK